MIEKNECKKDRILEEKVIIITRRNRKQVEKKNLK
jgi:hypothetical protein